MVLLLLIAAVVYYVTGDIVDAAVTAVALVPIAAVGLVLERRSQHALDRLRALTALSARVRRDGVCGSDRTLRLAPWGGRIGRRSQGDGFCRFGDGPIFLLVIERTRPRLLWQGVCDFGRVSGIVLALALVGIITAIYLPPLAELLKLVPLSPREWVFALMVSAACTLWAELLKLLRGRKVTGVSIIPS